MSFYIGFVRANYLAVAVLGSLPALLCGLPLLQSVFMRPQIGLRMNPPSTADVVMLITVSLLIITGIRAIWRRIVSGTVIPAELIRERPVVTMVITLSGVLGHFFMALVVPAVVEIMLTPEKGDDAGGPIFFGITLALLSYQIALLCGELVLVGDGVSDASRSRTDFN